MKKEHKLFFLLVLLNVIVRLPLTLHELGVDSFIIHSFANSIVEHGRAKWVIHPLSFFGFYPYSYASGVPYLLAISSIITGIGMELVVYFVSLLFGLGGLATAYAMAGEFNDNFHFKFLVAFIFSLSPISLKYTLWTVSARGLFLMVLPLFIWCMLRFHRKHQVKYLFMALLFIISLASIHKMFVLIFLIMVAYLLSVFIKKINLSVSQRIMIMFLLVLFISQSFLVKGKWTQRYTNFLGDNWYHYLVGLNFTLLARYGFLLPLAIIGLIFIFFKTDKSFTDWFLISTIFCFTILLGHSMYFFQTLLPFVSLSSAMCILYIFNRKNRFVSSKYLVTFILIAVFSFSILTLFVRLTNTDSAGYSNYMYPSTFSLANFIEKNTRQGQITGAQTAKLPAFSDNPTTDLSAPGLLIHDIVGKDDLDIKLRPLPSSIPELTDFVKSPFIFNPPYPIDDPDYLVQVVDDEEKVRVLSVQNKVYSNNVEGLWALDST